MILRFNFHASRCFHHGLRHCKCLLSITPQCSLRHLQECLLDRSTIDGTRLIEEHVIVVAGPCLATSCGNLAIGLLVELIAKAYEGEGLGVLRPRILIEAVTPAAQCIKRSLVRDVVNEGAAVSSTIKGVPERLELLLACSIPNL